MKTIKLLITGIFFFFLTNGIIAQGPPDPPDGHGSDEDQPGGNAPLSGGLIILMGLGAAYGGKKVFDLRKKEE